MIVDTHIHLNDARYQEILDEVIEEALAAGVSKMIISGYDRKSSVKAVELAHKYDACYAAVGLHPSEVHKGDSLGWLEPLLGEEKVVAVGEIVLDYYWDKTHRDLQIEFFKKQIAIARKANLPVVVHSREAAQDTYNVLKEKIPGVLHCFPYSPEMAVEFVKLGYYLGIGGVVTFKNARVLKEVVNAIDLRHLLTETDGPYLTPEPHRGKLNKPAYVKYVVEKIAEIKGMNAGVVADILYQNARNLFKI